MEYTIERKSKALIATMFSNSLPTPTIGGMVYPTRRKKKSTKISLTNPNCGTIIDITHIVMLNLIYAILIGLVWVECLPLKAERVAVHIPITDKVAVVPTSQVHTEKERVPP